MSLISSVFHTLNPLFKCQWMQVCCRKCEHGVMEVQENQHMTPILSPILFLTLGSFFLLKILSIPKAALQNTATQSRIPPVRFLGLKSLSIFSSLQDYNYYSCITQGRSVAEQDCSTNIHYCLLWETGRQKGRIPVLNSLVAKSCSSFQMKM